MTSARFCFWRVSFFLLSFFFLSSFLHSCCRQLCSGSYRIFLSFFLLLLLLLSTFQLLIISTCFMLFTPNLDTVTMTSSHLCHLTLGGQKVTQGSQGSKMWFCYKKFQLQQILSNRDEIWVHERFLACAQKLNLKLNSKVIKGHFRVKFENIFKKSLKITGRC